MINGIRSIAAFCGAQIIYFLIWFFGKRTSFDGNEWLQAPLGNQYIGDHPYDEVARGENLTVTRNAEKGGLIPDFSILKGDSFEPEKVHSKIHDFYENTAEHRMDVWSQTHFPASLALWLLVTTISRKVNQLNFPTSALETARGMTSEIVLLNRKEDGSLKYTGWFRKIAGTDRVLYTGFYMTESVPLHDSRCVKVVFPMPDGNATVILRPEVGEDGSLILNSAGNKEFGNVGFYRVRMRNGKLRVWRIHSLCEKFRLFVDDDDVLRCDHSVSFLGFHVLNLHYKIERKPLTN